MKKLIIAILLTSAVAAMASQPFVLEPIIPNKYKVKSGTSNAVVELPIADYLQIQRNFDKIARKIREGEYQADSNFVQKGTLTHSDFTYTLGLYQAIVQLPYKYESNTAYRVYFSRQAPAVTAGVANQVVELYTDSSFVVKSDTTGNGIYWLTVGIRKK